MSPGPSWIGTSPGDLAGRRFSELLTIGGKIFYETHFAPLLRMQGSFNEVALELACADGRKLPVLVNAAERYDSEGKPRFIRITIFNASERRRYEQNLLEAKKQAEAATRIEREASELKEQFMAVLGHDLRNPLASIASGIRMLGKEPLSERAAQLLALIEVSAIRASSLIDNVLDLARTRMGAGFSIAASTRPLAPVIEQVVAELRAIAPERQIETEVELTHPVRADADRIGQLLSNLLSNALAHGSANEPVRLSARTTDEAFELSVANGGKPIPPEVMEHLFQPFFRGAVDRGREGLGLGLFIASEIAKAHGGTLSVCSHTRETRFSFLMPRDEEFSPEEA